MTTINLRYIETIFLHAYENESYIDTDTPEYWEKIWPDYPWVDVQNAWQKFQALAEAETYWPKGPEEFDMAYNALYDQYQQALEDMVMIPGDQS